MTARAVPLGVPAGVPLATAGRRLSGPWRPTLSPDAVDAATSIWSLGLATASVTPHTLGLWTQMVAATTVPASAIDLWVHQGTFITAADSSMLLNIGIGGIAAEVIRIPQIGCGWRYVGVNGSPRSFLGRFPLDIPVGSRLSVQLQAVTSLDTANIGCRLVQLPFSSRSPQTLLALGANAATSAGVVLAAPGTINVKTGWTTIVASTPQRLSGLVVCCQGGSDTDHATANFLLDIGIGSAGNERVLLPDLYGSLSTSETVAFEQPGVWDVSIPAGSRIAARWQSISTADPIDVHLIGVPG